MGSEDKKRLIVESQGTLDYRSVVSNLKLLGSRFFHEVHTGKPNTTRTKTYETSALFTEDEPTLQSSHQPIGEEEHGFAGEHYVDEYLIEQWAEEGDPDAVVCMQFEEGVMDTLQGDPDMAACFNAYTDARKRLADRAKGRGFWGPSKKGQGKDRKGKGGRVDFRPRKPLAQRILESNCRRCGARGHWKAECPLRLQSNAPSGNTAPREGGTFTGLALHELAPEHEDMIPVEAPWSSFHDVFMVHHTQDQTPWGTVGTRVTHKKPGSRSHIRQCTLRLLPTMKAKLGLTESPLTMNTGEEPPVEVSANFVSHGSLGIVDLGASQTVIGEHQVAEVLQQLPESTKIREVPCSTIFRFGNSSTVTCDRALLIPLGPYYVKVCIVPSNTPFLLSNNLFRKLEASIHTASDEIFFGRLNLRLPLQLTEKKLYLLDFAELVRRAQEQSSHQVRGSQVINKENILSVGEEPEISRARNPALSSQTSMHAGQQCDSCPSHPEPTGVSNRHARQLRSVTFRPLQGPADECPDRATGSRDDDSRRTLHREDQLRGSQEGTDLSRSPAIRPEVCELVPQPLPGEHQTFPQDVCELSSQVHRGRGRQSRSDKRSTSGPNQGISEGQGGDDIPPSHHRREHGGVDRGDVGYGGRRPRESPPRRRNRTAEPEDHSDGTDDATTAASADPYRSPAGAIGRHHREQDHLSDGEPSEEVLVMPREVRSIILDCTGEEVFQMQPETVIDKEYFRDLNKGASNPIYQEMMQYFSKHYGNAEAIDHHLNRIGIELLEVYCDTNSQLTSQAQELGMKAVRFCRHHGDLGTFGGRCKLYDVIWITRPRNIWTAPNCGPWSGWSHLNAGKSLALAEKISQARSHERSHLHVCDALCRLQIRRRPECHFHLEQPVNSDMIFQGELSFIVHYALRAKFDMCIGGNLKHPEHQDRYLKKRMQVDNIPSPPSHNRTVAVCRTTSAHADSRELSGTRSRSHVNNKVHRAILPSFC